MQQRDGLRPWSSQKINEFAQFPAMADGRRSTRRSRCGPPVTRRTASSTSMTRRHGRRWRRARHPRQHRLVHAVVRASTSTPSLATWEGFTDNESIFATAETGDQGRFLGSPTRPTRSSTRRSPRASDSTSRSCTRVRRPASLAALDKAYDNQEPHPDVLVDAALGAMRSTTSSRSSCRPRRTTTSARRSLPKTPTPIGYAATTPTTCSTRRSAPSSRRRTPRRSSSSRTSTGRKQDQNEVAPGDRRRRPTPPRRPRAWIDANPTSWEAWLPQAS